MANGDGLAKSSGIAYRQSAAIVDSLLPRLEYVKGSAQGPRETVFSSGENRVGSTELKWELPGVIAPGASGHVSFQAVVR